MPQPNRKRPEGRFHDGDGAQLPAHTAHGEYSKACGQQRQQRQSPRIETRHGICRAASRNRRHCVVDCVRYLPCAWGCSPCALTKNACRAGVERRSIRDGGWQICGINHASNCESQTALVRQIEAHGIQRKCACAGGRTGCRTRSGTAPGSGLQACCQWICHAHPGDTHTTVITRRNRVLNWSICTHWCRRGRGFAELDVGLANLGAGRLD